MTTPPLRKTRASHATSASSRKRVTVAQLLRAFEDANLSAARQMEDNSTDDDIYTGKLRGSHGTQEGYERTHARHARKSDD